MTAGIFKAAAPSVPGGVDHTAAPARAYRAAAFGLIAVTAAAVFFFHLGSYGLWEPDEARYAEIAREMLSAGGFIVPHLNYVPYVEKPPLLYWMTALAFHLLGVNEFAARIVPAVSALAGVMLTWWFGRRVFERRRALLAAAILTTSPVYAAMAQVLTTDMLLTALLTAAFFALFLQWREGGRWWVAAYAAMALAVLTKGPVGVILPGAGAAVFVWRQGGLRGAIAKLRPLAGLVLVAAVALPWFIIIALRLPGFMDFYIIGEHFRRAFVSSYSHDQPFYFYLPVIVAGMLPWSICFPLLFRSGNPKAARAWCSSIAIVVLVLFSAARAKLIPYILPALPPIALLLADSIVSALEDARGAQPPARRWPAALVAGTGPALCAGAIACFVIAAAAPLFRVPEVRMLRSVLLAGGAILLIGGGAAALALRRRRYDPGLALVMLTAAGAMLAATYGRIEVESRHSWAALGRELAARAPNATLIDYHRYPQAIPFYTGRRVIVAGPFLSELRFGAEHSADRGGYFLRSDADLLALWNRDRGAVLIIDQAELRRLAPQLGALQVVAAQGHKIAVSRSLAAR